MKKVFVVVVEDLNGFGLLDSSVVLHIRTSDNNKAVECAKEIFIESYGYDNVDVEENLEFSAYELTDDEIIEA
jgi:hypothetical protein